MSAQYMLYVETEKAAKAEFKVATAPAREAYTQARAPLIKALKELKKHFESEIAEAKSLYDQREHDAWQLYKDSKKASEMVDLGK